MSRRTLFISDIHGRVDALQTLLANAKYNPAVDKLLLLGDYVGDSPDNLRCLIFVRELLQHGDVVALMGNHDAGLSNFLTESESTPSATSATSATSVRTASSAAPTPTLRPYMPALANAIQRRHPELHDLVTTLPHWHEDGDFIAVHAGVNPTLDDWRQSSPTDFMSIRKSFIDATLTLGKPVVFGHTPCINLHDSPEVWYSYDTGKIGIDGGASRHLQLNCLIYQDGNFDHISVPVD